MKIGTVLSIFFTSILVMVVVEGCVKDYLPVKPKPKVGKQTDQLEASFVTTPISNVNDPYWNESDYLVSDLTDLSTKNLYGLDGLFNMTGTYNGLSDFNKGEETTLKLRAAYDNNYLYILAEWGDQTINASRRTWLWDGPEDPRKPSDTTSGWSSQRNDDHIALAFDINGASTSAGMFSAIGCAAACHTSGGKNTMAPETGTVDIWNWSVALSGPFGYALDMNANADSGLINDSGTKFFHRNSSDQNNQRKGPAFEWDGVSQDVTLASGNPSKLDPAFYLLNKAPFIGDPAVGEVLYSDHDKGCEGCHGEKGEGYGLNGDGVPFNNETFGRKYSRTTLKAQANSPDHDGQTYFNKLSGQEKDDLIAYIRGLAGVPGYYLTPPIQGESITDVTASTSANLVRIETSKDNGHYKVLFIRKLSTGKADDASFDPLLVKSYPFGVALMDNDGKNHIGSIMETLIFKD